ncbi:translation initiation factor IF-3 [candidate division BRC1 bacterium HGW-BRC1-1]|nr:MAG: translation initiation factor IF-3 [candidate division BRC1 bacterium HGW-BRC1-1]
MRENYRVNREIRSREVRLINQNNEQLGVVPVTEAMRLAEEAELDLVEVAPEAKPPVCKIVDYKKVIYEQKRRLRDSRKKAKTIEIKEVKMRPSIDKHDYDTKINHAREFLQAGHKVKVTFTYKSRERLYQDRAMKLLQRVLTDLEDVAVQEAVNRMGATLTGCLLSFKREAAAPSRST